MNMKNIHLTGVCGVAMGSLACMLKERGFNVTGSDENIYPPMSTILRDKGIPLVSGFEAKNVLHADLVIIGNSISRGNPEVEHVLDAHAPYMSMARALYEFFLYDREVISVSGTHGKSTTTALLAHILDAAGEDPSFLVGATSKNYQGNYRLGRGRFFVIEGDEYDSAFFEKVPKFTLYRPSHLILTSLEFDHADIYRDLEEIALWFRRLINMVPSRGHILYNEDYPALAGTVRGSLSHLRSYGRGRGDFSYSSREIRDEHTVTALTHPGSETLEVLSPLFGDFNSSNIAAAVSMALLLGIDVPAIERGVKGFQGVLRRQDLIYDSGSVMIYDDFAHHPTAIRSVLAAMRERYGSAVIWAVYEPRSATSRRNVFQNVLHEAFVPAHRVVMKSPYRLDSIRPDDRIDIGSVCARIGEGGRPCHLFNSTDGIIDHIVKNIDTRNRNIIVIMSNGGFDGIYTRLPEALKATT